MVGGTGHNLFGTSWLEKFALDWPRLMRTVNVVGDFIPHQDLEEIVNRHSAVFSEGLATYTGPAVNIHVESGAKPKFCAARPIPYAWRDRVG